MPDIAPQVALDVLIEYCPRCLTGQNIVLEDADGLADLKTQILFPVGVGRHNALIAQKERIPSVVGYSLLHVALLHDGRN